MSVKDVLDRAGMALAAIGSGSPDQARTFVEKAGFDGEMYVSQDLAAYRAFRLFRGILRTLGPASIFSGLRAIRKGFRQGSTAGDNWQQGGLFIVGPESRLLFEHRDRFAGDQADLHEVISVIS